MKYNGNDIYGERLLAGHCEVHPHVPYEYPCPECRNEDDDRQAQFESYREYYEEIERKHWQDVQNEIMESEKNEV